MAAGWWAATLATISTQLNKLSTALTGEILDQGSIATTMHKPSTTVTGSGSWSLGMGTILKKLSTSMPGNVSNNGTIATTLKKLVTASTGVNHSAVYDTVGAGVAFSKFGSGSETVTGSYTAASGADLFVAFCWDRSAGVSVSSASFGSSSSSTPSASLLNNNDSTKGGLVVFRLPGAGTGSSQTVTVNYSHTVAVAGCMNVVSVKTVSTVDAAVTQYGSSNSLAISISGSDTMALQFVASGNGTGTVSQWNSHSGITNVANMTDAAGSAQLLINTATPPTTSNIGSPSANAYSSVIIPIQ